jgi:bacterioferritin-associated ferredoxin
MYVCICQSVTDREIRRQAADGVRAFAELQARTGCSTCCGRCEGEARQVLANAVREERMSLPMVAAA